MKVFPDDLLYSHEHIWLRVDGDIGVIGITDYAQEKLGEVLNIELPDEDSSIEIDEPFASIESAKGVMELISPVSGEVLGINDDIADDIGIINSDPYDTGWLIKIEITDIEELDELLDAKGYYDFVLQELEE